MPSFVRCRRVTRGGARLALAAFAAGAGCSTTPEAGPLDVAPAPADVEAVRQAARPVTGGAGDYDPLLALAGADVRLVLLGENTHGTHEFYAARARITQRLVAERGFTGVAVEGDWPDAYRVNDYVRGLGTDRSAEEALSSFDDFPEWMWRNADVRDLVRWLRDHNAARPPAERVGFYGLDVQDLYGPIDLVLKYLDATDAAAAARVRTLYACFDPYRPDAERYAAAAGGGRSCTAQAREAAAELERVAAARPADRAAAGSAAAEAQFGALRGAHAVASAEAYFRAAYAGTGNSWNLRDSLMTGTLEAVLAHLGPAPGGAAAGRPARAVVWAHNTHVGDARQTQMGEGGELNIGQLARQRYGDAALLVGFFTYTGTVYATRAWGQPGQVRSVKPALAGSVSALFHGTGVPGFVLPLRGGGAAADRLAQPRLQRAIGVVYQPDTERQSHYFTARLSRQFDAVTFFDVTRAVTPLRVGAAGTAPIGSAGPARSRTPSRDR